MTKTEAGTVRREIVVPAPIERAFAVFTERFGDFKPPEHNLLGAPITETVFEPRVGGNIVDRAADGSECRWARILAYEPPNRVVFSWDTSPHWRVETDPDLTSEVEVRFVAETALSTRLELEHRPHRPARTRLGSRQRGCGRRRGMAAVPGPLRGSVDGGQLNVGDRREHRGRTVGSRDEPSMFMAVAAFLGEACPPA